MCWSENIQFQIVRDISLKFAFFILPLSDFGIEQYWPHQISWECCPTLLFSIGDYVKLFLIFKIFVIILSWIDDFFSQKFYITFSTFLIVIGLFRRCI